jgi:hypothetical protein
MRYWFAGLIFIATPIAAQEIHHHEGMPEAVDRFYSTWRQPAYGNPRTMGCCDRTDCYPTQAKFQDGLWFAKHRETGRWIIIPPDKVEHDQIDPRESPDGRTHLCANRYGTVYCFVVGSQI